MKKSKQKEILSKKQLERLAEALAKRNKKTEKTETKKELKNSKLIEENKFIESGIALEKVSPVLKPAAKAQEGLEQISSSFLLQRKQENQTMEKPYESEGQKYFSQSGEYKNINKMQSENLQTPSDIGREMVHMGIEQATKRKSERFFDEKQEKKYSADIKPLDEIRDNKKKLYTPR